MTARPRNPIWDALVEVFGYSPALPHAQRHWGLIVKELAAAGFTAEQVVLAGKGYRRMYPNVAFTPAALHKHFEAALAEGTPKRKRHLRAVNESYPDDSGERVPPPAEAVEAMRKLGLKGIE